MSTYLTQQWRAEHGRLPKLRRCHMAQVEGSALVAQAIRREGIEVLFGLAGGPIQDIMGCASHCGVRPIGVHHEQAATFAAAAYGYVKNQVGVAVLAAGPGVTNGVTGAHVAYDNCFPLVILGGSGPQRARYTGTFQETENIPMFKGITKMALQPQSPDFLRLGGSHGQCAGQYLRYLSTKTIGCAISTACVYGGTAAH